jgi:hypothetical protein
MLTGWMNDKRLQPDLQPAIVKLTGALSGGFRCLSKSRSRSVRIHQFSGTLHSYFEFASSRISIKALNPKAYERQPKPVIFPLQTPEMSDLCLNSSRA